MVKEGIDNPTSFMNIKNRVQDNLDIMSQIFKNKDDLLKAQGNIPIYYLLVKKLGNKPDLREFLVKFEAQLKDVKNVPAADSDTQGLLSYAILKRSTNDQNSITKRVEILLEKYTSASQAL